jgi:hypothetical protein
MAVPKRKLSVSLDEDLVEALESGGAPVSIQVNDAVRAEVLRRRQQEALVALCDDYAAESGGWTDADETEIQRIMRLLGG